MNTPWGPSQSIVKLHGTDIVQVSTASHGGIGVRVSFAANNLSKAARVAAINQGQYYWFEEDCLCAIPAYELRQFVDKWAQFEFYTKNLSHLKYWCPKYCMEMGLVDTLCYNNALTYMPDYGITEG